jgi:hypothetical protein
MSLRQLSYKLEISFWAAIIPIMTEVRPLRFLLSKVNQALTSSRQQKKLIYLVATALIAWCLGFTLGLLSMF